ncbi:MAG TPA: D-alanyl-D-alanine carboxypeptidase family protein, partial [Spirochaetia bacterium]|nr:D-alanyl-D-alanine carboxypeptidase family protein [Spirochaetia bacterium]
AAAWKKLEAEAGREGIRLGIISAHRPVDYQRRIFLNLLKIGALNEIGRPYTDGEIAGGMADGLIDRVLRESSIPGYSKHHSGYTIDITDLSSGRDFTEFGHTSGFQWISAKNYLKAKKYGFIPSYPYGAAGQGPDPEPWEYVWVGTEALVKPALITH